MFHLGPRSAPKFYPFHFTQSSAPDLSLKLRRQKVTPSCLSQPNFPPVPAVATLLRFPFLFLVNFRHLVFVGLCAVLGPLAARAQTTATLTTSTATLNPAGGRVTFTFGVTFDGTAGYGVTVNLPSTWSYVSGTTEPSIRPSAGQTGSLDWATLIR